MLDLAFIGSGRMANAILTGLLHQNLTTPDRVRCTGARDGTAEGLASQHGITATYQLDHLIGEADWIILACKPQQFADLPSELAPLTRQRKILSILAGTPLARLQSRFPDAAQFIRAMPNTPGQIGAGITAFAAANHLSDSDRITITRLLGALGEVVEVEENQLDAVTGLSGSGPAYVFAFIEALRDAGVAAGLSEEVAYRLAHQTIKGSAALLEADPVGPEIHRERVSSPGGTTLAGLEVLKEAGLPDILRRTVLAARDRSRELAEG